MEGVREKLLGYNIYIMIIYAVIAFVVFFLWYRSAFIKRAKSAFQVIQRQVGYYGLNDGTRNICVYSAYSCFH